MFGVDHMYFPANGGGYGRDVTYQRLAQCSACAPGKCWANASSPTAPAWCCTAAGNDGPCTQPFDPEGLVSSLTCVVAAVFGLHWGHVLLMFTDPADRKRQFALTGGAGVAIGTAMHFSHSGCTEGWHGLCSGGVPWNTDLYSVSFLLLTGGVSGLLMGLCYELVDVRGITRCVQCA